MKKKASSLIGSTMKVGMYSVVLKKKIGEGGYAWVYLVEDSQRNQYALKYVRCLNQDKFEQFLKEYTFLKSLPEHPNIVKLFDAESDPTTGVIKFLFEYAPTTAIGIMSNRPLSHQEILVFFHAICEATAFLHAQRPAICHRDLKPENILVGQNGVPKLCDFGSATAMIYQIEDPSMIPKVQEDIEQNTTMNYRAPEMIDLYSNNIIGPPADVWALGCTLFKLITRDDVYKPDDRLAILQARVTIPAGTDTFLEHVIRSCLQVDISKRPTAAQLAASVLSKRGKTNTVDVPHRSSPSSSGTDSSWRVLTFVKEAIASISATGIEAAAVKATSANDAPPKMKHVRRLVLAVAHQPESASAIIDLLLKRPWDVDARIAAKVLFCLLLLAQYHPRPAEILPASVRTDAVVQRYAAGRKIGGGGEQSSLTAIASIGAAVRVKLMLHGAHPGLAGDMRGGRDDSHLAGDLEGHVATITQCARQVLSAAKGADAFAMSVLAMPLLNEVAASAALLRAIAPSADLQEADSLLQGARRDQYLATAVSAFVQ